MNTSDTYRHDYSEAAALKALLDTIDAAGKDFVERAEKHDDFTGQFTINIGGKSIAFYLGGPQMDGLYTFIHHIADENFYFIDKDNNVTSHLF